MSEKYTVISLPGGKDPGYGYPGDEPPQKMIDRYRELAERKRREADEILAACDADFNIRVERGVWNPKVLRTVQEGRGA